MPYAGLTTALIAKDLRIVLSNPGAFCQALLLGLLIIFLFSISGETGETIRPAEAATIFWLGSAFCQILIFGILFALEETNSNRCALLLCPAPVQAIWLAKALAGLVMLLLTQIILLPATIIFLNQQIPGLADKAWLGILAVDLGLVIPGALLGALTQGQSGKDALLSVLLFPLLVPVLMAGVNLLARLLTPETDTSGDAWLGIALAFDAIFAGASLLLFGFIYGGED